MVQMPHNFPKTREKHKCECTVIEDMAHIYNCEMYNNNKKQRSIAYNKISNGNLQEEITVYTILKRNLELIEKMTNERNSPCEPCDPIL